MFEVHPLSFTEWKDTSSENWSETYKTMRENLMHDIVHFSDLRDEVGHDVAIQRFSDILDKAIANGQQQLVTDNLLLAYSAVADIIDMLVTEDSIDGEEEETAPDGSVPVELDVRVV